jgi:hypothetical protein
MRVLRPALYGECSAEDIVLAKVSVLPEAAAPSFAAVNITDDRFGAVPRNYAECLRHNALPITHQRRTQAAQLSCRADGLVAPSIRLGVGRTHSQVAA